jgi:hypothetical protein
MRQTTVSELVESVRVPDQPRKSGAYTSGLHAAGKLTTELSSLKAGVALKALTLTGTGPDFPYIDLAVLGDLTTLQQLQFLEQSL